ncbi:MAG TPA: hypothetical protein VM030_01115 [Acidimicrobiales bacterium]|nr:hypothetical protein [Acidimicrobiales bacterium]
MAALVIGAFAYLAFFNAAWWLWVANSAFRGIRGPTDIGLGVQCVVMTVAPLAVAGGTYWWTQPSRRSRRRRLVMSALAGIGLTLIAVLYSALLAGPF